MQNSPTGRLKRELRTGISLGIAVQFGFPEIKLGLGKAREAASRVAMPAPEAAMHEDDGMVFRQHDVGMSRQVPEVKSKSKAHAMQKLPNRYLGPGALGSNEAHPPAALAGGKCVHDQPE